MKKYLDFFFRPKDDLASLPALRARLLNAMLVICVAIGTLLFGLMLIPAIQRKLYLAIGGYGAVYLLLVLLTVFYKISYRWRVFFFLYIVYLLGTINLAVEGFTIDSGILLLAFILLAALYGGVRNGLIALGVSSATIAIAGFLVVKRIIIPVVALAPSDLFLWVIGGLLWVLMGGFFIISITSLLRGLEQNLERVTGLAEDLARINATVEKSEERFRSLIEGSTDIIAILARDGSITYISPSAERIMGYKVEDLIGRNIFSFLHPEDAQLAYAALMPGTPAEEIGPFLESRVRHASGSWRWLEVKGRQVFNSPSINGTVVNCRDITDRKEIEANLQRSQQQLEAAKKALEARVVETTEEAERASKQLQELVSHSPAVIYSADISEGQVITFVSENVAALSGYAAEAFLREAGFLRQIIHPEDVQHVRVEIERARKTGEAAFDYRFLHKCGEYRWVHDDMRLVKDEQGKPVELVGSWVDITELKVAEEALRKSEAENRVILNSTDAIISMLDRDGKILSVNEAGAAMHHTSVLAMLGKNIFDYFPPEISASRREMMEQVFQTGKPVRFEDNRAGRWFDNNIYPILDEQGAVTRVVTHTIDITERKKIEESLQQSEERYRTLAEASPDLIYIIDKDDCIQYVNSYAAAFLGSPLEKLIGQPRSRYFSSKTNDGQRRKILNVLRSGENSYSENNNEIGNRSIWLGTWLVPMLDAGGNVSSVLGISRDITARKQAEMEILRSRDLLEERVKERTAALIASQNQLRELTSQLVTAQEEERRRISRELHDEAGQALITLKYSLASFVSEIPESHAMVKQRVTDAIRISDQMMTQIRTLAHSLRPPVLEVGGINLSLKDYCDEFTERTSLAIDYEGVEIPSLPDEIGISLYRFVQETLTNILKHANATRVEVRLKYRRNTIALSVTDNGRGIDSSAQTGGIGLLGVEERFNLIGGRVEIRSRKGRGVKASAYVPWSKKNSFF